jgi:low temperature requirement protein LtrA
VSVVTRLGRLVPSREGDGVTTLELFFDLVYVFAFTQVTTLMAHGTAPRSLVEGAIVLALLWWTWCSYAWLANHVRGDRGILRAALVVVMVTMFVACLAIPEAFHDEPGGLDGPVTLVVCYGLVRLVHLAVYLAAAGEDRALRRQVLASLAASAVPATVLLLVGAVVGHGWQLPIWTAAVLYDLGAIFVTSRGGGGWVLASAAHFAERHGLVVILALGESVVAIGAGVSQEPVSAPVVVAAALAVLLAAGLWWTYFAHVAERLEHGLAAVSGRERARMGRDVFTYLHLPIVAGIVLAALGVEQATAHLDDDHLGATGAWALALGLAACLVGTTAATRRASGELLPGRLVAAFVLLATAAPLAAAPPVAALAVATAIVGAVCLLERSASPASGH